MKRLINIADKNLVNDVLQRSNRFLRMADKGYSLMLVVVLILLWHFSVALGWVENFILPYPVDVVRTLIKIRSDLWVHLKVTMQEAVYGLGIAILFSVVIAFTMDRFDQVKKALIPIFLVSQTIPVILLAPLFAMIFGLGMTPKVIVVVLVCFFPIVIGLNEGLESVDQDEVDLLRSMGASAFQIFSVVKFPSVAINFFSGLKIAATYSFMGAVIGEWMGGSTGLGIYYLRARKSFDINRVFAVVLVIVGVSMLIYYTVAVVQRVTMPWHQEKKR